MPNQTNPFKLLPLLILALTPTLSANYYSIIKDQKTPNQYVEHDIFSYATPVLSISKELQCLHNQDSYSLKKEEYNDILLLHETHLRLSTSALYKSTNRFCRGFCFDKGMINLVQEREKNSSYLLGVHSLVNTREKLVVSDGVTFSKKAIGNIQKVVNNYLNEKVKKR